MTVSRSLGFGAQLEAISKNIGLSLDQTRRGVSIALFGEVVERSPVDSGRFRGNWQTAANAQKTTPITRDDKAPLGSPPGSAVQAEIDANLGKLGDIVYFTNNLPYAERLEYGYSGQAPAGMVRTSVSRFEGLVAAEAAKNKV